jgi:hypothetical protein
MNIPSSQIRVNAAISYCFLAPLFLLAGNNPIYAESFVREHSWRAIKLQIGLLAYYVFSAFILSGLLSYTIPVLELRVDRIVTLGVTIIVFGLLVYGALQAFKGNTAGASGLKNLMLAEQPNLDTGSLSESDIARTLWAFVPFVSFFVVERFTTPLVVIGAKITGFLTLCLVASIALSRGDSLFYSLLFLLVLSFVSMAIHLVFKLEPAYLGLAQYLPSLNACMSAVRAMPWYLADLFRVLVGKLDHLSFADHYRRTLERDQKFEFKLAEHFTDSKMALSPYLIYVPGLNVLLLSLFFAPGKSRYALAVGQGIVLTLLCLGVGFWYGWNSSYLLFALIPIAMGLATVQVRPFARIPVLYELSVLLSYASFGIVRGSREARAKSAQVNEVSLKVE